MISYVSILFLGRGGTPTTEHCHNGQFYKTAVGMANKMLSSFVFIRKFQIKKTFKIQTKIINCKIKLEKLNDIVTD